MHYAKPFQGGVGLPCRDKTSSRQRSVPVRGALPISFPDLLPFRSGRRAQCAAAESRLLKAISGTDRGLTTTGEQKAEILEAVEELAELGRGSISTGGKISATWRLLWTTEKVLRRRIAILALLCCMRTTLLLIHSALCRPPRRPSSSSKTRRGSGPRSATSTRHALHHHMLQDMKHAGRALPHA